MRIDHRIQIQVGHDLQHVGAHPDLVVHLLQIAGGTDLAGHGIAHIAFAERVEQTLFQDLRHAVDGPVGGQGSQIAVQIVLEVIQMDRDLAGQPGLVDIIVTGSSQSRISTP